MLARDEGRHLCDEASGAIGTLGGYHDGVSPTGSHDVVDVIGSRSGEHLQGNGRCMAHPSHAMLVHP